MSSRGVAVGKLVELFEREGRGCLNMREDRGIALVLASEPGIVCLSVRHSRSNGRVEMCGRWWCDWQ